MEISNDLMIGLGVGSTIGLVVVGALIVAMKDRAQVAKNSDAIETLEATLKNAATVAMNQAQWSKQAQGVIGAMGKEIKALGLKVRANPTPVITTVELTSDEDAKE